MRMLKKLSLVLPVMGMLIGLPTLTSATSASAATTAPRVPNNCVAYTEYEGGMEGGSAQCLGGTGHFRVLIYCTNNPQNGWGTYYTGPWLPTGSGNVSLAWCPSNQPYAVAAGYDLANW
jgi:hypothetical protein